MPRTGRCAPPAERPSARFHPIGTGELIVDALFGIGLARALDGDYARWVEWANTVATPILALDVPSGLDADTGAAPGPCILAAKTASFIALKPGLLTGDGPDRCGEVVVLDLDLDLPVPAIGGKLLHWVDLARRLPPVLRRQRRNVHKGSFGTLGIVGGADRHGRRAAPRRPRGAVRRCRQDAGRVSRPSPRRCSTPRRPSSC